MQIKFLTIYHDFDDVEYSKREAQDSLLYMWMRSLQLQRIKFISAAKVEFKEYSLLEYPNQEKARKEIWNAYGHKDRRSKNKIVWRWSGIEYDDFEAFYAKVAEQKRLMELTITPEDYP